ncbi:MAG: methionyl-tRNA formyltransferase [Bacteroidales bacterium]|jgi:methionyl-tRNA formyltransferase|nr:methionyl-tRNA formyltransferase [Bacteroidales bacterium]
MTGKNLRIVFFGTPDFATAQLDALVQGGYNVVAVVTMPDKQAGRGLKVIHSSVKQYALQNNLPLLQPADLKDENFIRQLSSLNVDLQIVVAFRMLPRIVYAMPRLGTFNLHASLLPLYRGAAPINWAIINGEKQTGLTTFLLNDRMDEGEIILQQSIAINPDDNFGSLHDRMMKEGRNLVKETVNVIAKGNFKTLLQNSQTKPQSLAPKIYKNTTIIDWNQNGEKIIDFIRGLSPSPCAISYFFDKKDEKEHLFKVFEARFFMKSDKKNTGIFSISPEKEILVSCLDGEIQLLDLQLSGKRRMKSEEFLRGWKSTNNLITIKK